MSDKIVSLFSGCGGLDLGFTQVGARIIWANERDKYACETYRCNLGDHIIHGDIADAFPTMPKCADGVIGGFPCVDFSSLGRRRGLHGGSGQLYEWMVKAIRRCDPAWYLAENVPRLQSDFDTWRIIRRAFVLPGYRLSPVIVNFADYGVPQRRRRLLIIGHKFDWMLPLPTTRRHITVGEALEGIPVGAPNHALLDLTEQERRLLSFIGEGENLRIAYERSDHVKRLSNYKNPPFNDIMRRYHRARPAWTIAGSSGTGGGQYRFHPTENRRCTMRESARLQGFPDSFEFIGPQTAIRDQIANAVPPAGIRRIAQSLIEQESAIGLFMP